MMIKKAITLLTFSAFNAVGFVLILIMATWLGNWAGGLEPEVFEWEKIRKLWTFFFAATLFITVLLMKVYSIRKDNSKETSNKK